MEDLESKEKGSNLEAGFRFARERVSVSKGKRGMRERERAKKQWPISDTSSTTESTNGGALFRAIFVREFEFKRQRREKTTKSHSSAVTETLSKHLFICFYNYAFDLKSSKKRREEEKGSSVQKYIKEGLQAFSIEHRVRKRCVQKSLEMSVWKKGKERGDKNTH